MSILIEALNYKKKPIKRNNNTFCKSFCTLPKILLLKLGTAIESVIWDIQRELGLESLLLGIERSRLFHLGWGTFGSPSGAWKHCWRAGRGNLVTSQPHSRRAGEKKEIVRQIYGMDGLMNGLMVLQLFMSNMAYSF